MTAHERLQIITHIAASTPYLDGSFLPANGAESWHELRINCTHLIDALAAVRSIAGGYELMIGRKPVSDDDFDRLQEAIWGVERALEELQQKHIKQTGRRL